MTLRLNKHRKKRMVITPVAGRFYLKDRLTGKQIGIYDTVDAAISASISHILGLNKEIN